MDKKTKKIDLYSELREGLEERVAVEKGQKGPTRVHHFFATDDIRALREKRVSPSVSSPKCWASA